MKRFLQNSALVVASLMISVLAAEVVLRVADPFETRVIADRITLPVGRVYEISPDVATPGMDDVIVHRKNRLGFRGEDWPANPEDREKWIFVGGSTTESFYFNDDDTWVAGVERLQRPQRPTLWINNAGFDGHSSFGHLVLTRDYLIDLGPEKIFYMIGINDVGYDAPHHFDDRLESAEIGDWLRRRTEIGKLVNLMRRAGRAKQLGLVHGFHADWATSLGATDRFALSPGARDAVLATHLNDFIPAYRERIDALVALVRDHGIEPVLITQPALFGPATDPATGFDLGATRHEDVTGAVDGATRWQVLEAYNDVLRSVAGQRGVALIDLARDLPKDSRLFYDWIHYNKAGQAKVARIVSAAVDRLFPAGD
ncbi:MAG: GDSL-type esterase/lipase family protein [Rhodospirillales bacterium]